MTMPIYEFKCKNFDHVFEIIMSKTSGGTCPKCHSKKLDKQHSVFSAAVKNSSSGETEVPPHCESCPNRPDLAGPFSMN